MNDLVIQEIQEGNGVEHSEISKDQMKQILTENVDGMQFNKPTRSNESERVTLKKTSDKAIHALEEISQKQTFKIGSVSRKHCETNH